MDPHAVVILDVSFFLSCRQCGC